MVEDKKNGLIGLLGDGTRIANGLVNPIKEGVFDPALPLKAVDNAIGQIPIVGTVLSNGLPGPEDVMEGGASLFFQTTEKWFKQASDYVAKHGKPDPNQTQVAAKPVKAHGLPESLKPEKDNGIA